MDIKLKRAYDLAEESDGMRIYVDRLWPRGLSHETFKYDIWDKDIAPTTELREWFHADPVNRWDAFEKRYLEELQANPAVEQLRNQISGHKVITLLYSSKDPLHNNAAVLGTFLRSL